MQKIKVLISAPGDQDDNVKATISEIEEFNNLMSKRDVYFECLHWQKNISTGRSDRAQDVINTQINDADMIIAIIGTRIGTDTGKAISGTAEEVFDFCERVGFQNNSFNTHVFFNTQFEGNVLSIDPAQLAKVHIFQKQLQEMGVLYAPFSNSSTLCNLIRRALDSYYFQSEKTSDVSLTDDEHIELGLDDYFTNAANCMSEGTNNLKEIAHEFEQFSSQITKATKNATPEAILKIGIKAINNLANKISSPVDKAQESFNNAYSNTIGGTMILVEDFDKEINKEEILPLIQNLDGLIQNGLEGNKALTTLVDQIKQLPRKNSQLIKAKKRVLSPLSQLKKTIADFSNNMTIVKNTLQDYLNG